MPKHSHQHMLKLTARVPRGHEGFWQIIRKLDPKGPWSVQDVHGYTNILHHQTVNDFVLRLLKAGYVEQVGTKPGTRTTKVLKLYRLLKRPSETPSLRRDGTTLEMPAQQRMWNAMRAMKEFTLAGLSNAACDSQHRPVPYYTAQRYVSHLVRVGYLIDVSRGFYRVKASMNTGPSAPKILRLHVVFDTNRNAVMGEPTDAEAVA